MPALPALRKLCQCRECYGTTSTDPKTGLRIKGIYLKQSQFAIHQLRAAEAEIASSKESTTGLSTPAGSLELPAEPDSPHNASLDSSAQSPAATPTEDYIRLLRAYKIRLDWDPIKGLEAHAEKNPPLFVSTSTGCEMDHSAAANEEFYIQHTWLTQVRAYVMDNGLLRQKDSTHIRLLAETIMRLVDAQLHAYDRLVETQKELAQQRSIRADCHVVDTCWFQLCVRYIRTDLVGL